jgi:hypothetical protein
LGTHSLTDAELAPISALAQIHGTYEDALLARLSGRGWPSTVELSVVLTRRVADHLLTTHPHVHLALSGLHDVPWHPGPAEATLGGRSVALERVDDVWSLVVRELSPGLARDVAVAWRAAQQTLEQQWLLDNFHSQTFATEDEGQSAWDELRRSVNPDDTPLRTMVHLLFQLSGDVAGERAWLQTVL